MNKRSMDSMLGKDLGAAEQAIRDAADDLDAGFFGAEQLGLAEEAA